MLDVQIKGLDKLAMYLSPAKTRSALLRGMNKGMLYVRSRLPGYPAERSGQKYRRTGTLGRRNTTEVREQGTDIIGVLGNNTEYAEWVIARDTQAWMHVDRWYTLDDHLEDNLQGLADVVDGELERAYR